MKKVLVLIVALIFTIVLGSSVSLFFEDKIIYLLSSIDSKNSDRKCHRSGCGGELCGEGHFASDCRWSPEFACYKKTDCKVQKNGECGFTMTKGVRECVGLHRKKGDEK